MTIYYIHTYDFVDNQKGITETNKSVNCRDLVCQASVEK